MRKHMTMSITQKKEESDKLVSKYPNRVPVIVHTEKGLPKLDKSKFLVPYDLLLSEFVYVVRRRMKLGSKKSLMLLSNETLLRANDTMKTIFDAEGDKDTNFLYVNAVAENTFGGLTFKGKKCDVGPHGGIFMKMLKNKKKYLTPKQRKQVKGKSKKTVVRRKRKRKKKVIKGGSGYDSDGYLKKWYSD